MGIGAESGHAGMTVGHASPEGDFACVHGRNTVLGSVGIRKLLLEVFSYSSNQAFRRQCVTYGIKAVVDFADHPWLR